jgi:hypothetical protein
VGGNIIGRESHTYFKERLTDSEEGRPIVPKVTPLNDMNVKGRS